MLADKEKFLNSKMAKELKTILKNGILVAHNAKFDIAMLEAEGLSVPKFICTLRVARFLDKENKIPEYGLQYLRYYLDLDVEAHAHNAEDDVKVLHALFERLLAKIKDPSEVKNSKLHGAGETGNEDKAIEKMIEISKNPSLFVKFNFGKYKDQVIEDVLKSDRRYLEWLLGEKLKNDANDEDWIYTLQYYLDK